jgi:hypothetical protein
MTTIATEHSPVITAVETQERNRNRMGEISLAGGLLVGAYVESGSIRTGLAVAAGLLMGHVTLSSGQSHPGISQEKSQIQ